MKPMVTIRDEKKAFLQLAAFFKKTFFGEFSLRPLSYFVKRVFLLLKDQEFRHKDGKTKKVSTSADDLYSGASDPALATRLPSRTNRTSFGTPIWILFARIWLLLVPVIPLNGQTAVETVYRVFIVVELLRRCYLRWDTHSTRRPAEHRYI